MTAGPLVSVVVPAWNSDRTLLDTLQSVAAQTYSSLEIIIVDDGSTDNTATVARNFCRLDSRARLIRTENCGVSSARNRGIAEAVGDWIAPIDADDIWHPTKIEKQMQVALDAAASEPVGLVYCWYREVDAGACVVSSGPRLRLTGRVFYQFAYVNPVENGSAPLLSRDALLAVGGYDEDLPPYEDPMVQLRIADRFRVAMVPEHLVGWRRHETNASSNVDAIYARAQAMYARLREEGADLPDAISRWVSARGALHTARQRFGARRLVEAVAWLGKSLWRDPLRNTLQMLHHGGRVATTLANGITPEEQRLRFADVDPAAEIPPDPGSLSAIVGLIERVDRKRLMRLSHLDASLARSGGGKLVRKTPGIDVADTQSGKRKQT